MTETALEERRNARIAQEEVQDEIAEAQIPRPEAHVCAHASDEKC